MRWPRVKENPVYWGLPIGGQVLDILDVRAWANTIHFPADNPDPAEVARFAIKAKSDGLLDGIVPVLWKFDNQGRVYWERAASLLLYEDDKILWKAAKEKRLDELQHPKRRKARQLGEYLDEEHHHLLPV